MINQFALESFILGLNQITGVLMKKFFVLLIIIFPPAMGFSVYILRVRWPSNWLEAFFWFWVAILGWMSLLAALAEMSGYNVKSVLSQLKRRKPKPPQTMEVSNSLTKNVQPSKITIAWHRSNQIDWSTYFSNPWTTLKLLKLSIREKQRFMNSKIR
jgi:hypothetical protein